MSSSKAPPAKRRRTATRRGQQPSTVAPPTEVTPQQNKPLNDVSDIQELATALLPAIVPAVTQGVIATLKDLGLLPSAVGLAQPDKQLPPASQQDSTAVEESNLAQGCHEVVMSADFVGAGPSTTSIGTKTMPSIARPLEFRIDVRIKGEIWANQYVNFGSLVASKSSDKIELVEGGEGVLLCKKSSTASIGSIGKWMEAFHVFVAIYTAKYPSDAPQLMKYSHIVQTLSRRAGDEAALFYDENFRLWRENHPELLPWGQINTELQNEALAMGLARSLKFSGRPTVSNSQAMGRKTKHDNKSQGACFRFNNSGHCSRQNCPFRHSCQKCGGTHSRKQCNAPSKQQPSMPTNRMGQHTNSGLKRPGQTASTSRS